LLACSFNNADALLLRGIYSAAFVELTLAIANHFCVDFKQLEVYAERGWFSVKQLNGR